MSAQLVCQTCGADFYVSHHILALYPGWIPPKCLKCDPHCALPTGQSSKSNFGQKVMRTVCRSSRRAMRR